MIKISSLLAAIVMPKGRLAALAYVGEFVERAKKSGAVRQAIETAGLRGVVTAPAVP